jgi:hypothetical protein
MNPFDMFLRSCAEDCVNARYYNGEVPEHDCYCECEECIPPRPLSQVDRVDAAKYALARAWDSARWYARRLAMPYAKVENDISRRLAWMEFRQALYWRDLLDELESDKHEVRP